jgi:site-specific DNA recombinase
MQIALYARVSTRGQQQTQTIDQQLERLQAYAATHPDWQISAEHIYRDDGFSGAKLNRPGLDRLRDHARAARFSHVLITAPDRLARTYVHQVLLIDELHQLGCSIEFVERPMSDDPHDQLLLQIRGAVAEYERTLIADRMRRGRQARVRQGQLLPWPIAPYGYVLDADHPRDPQGMRLHPVTSAVVQQIFTWFTDPQAPMTLYQVTKQLTTAGIPTPKGKRRWNPSTVRHILRSPLYYGMAAYGRTRPVPARRRKSALEPIGPGISTQPTAPEEWIMIPVPAIVSREVFEIAQTRLDQNKQMARRNNTTHDYLLRGLLSCGRCHLTCSGREVDPSYRYYVCAGRSKTLRAPAGERCYARYIPAQALDELVWQDLCRVLREPALLTHELMRAQGGEWLPQALQAQRKTVQQALAHLERQQARLLEVYLAEVIGREEFERKRHELSQTQEGLQVQLRQLDAQAQQHLDLIGLTQGLTAFCERVAPTLEQLDFSQRRQLIELLIDRVIVEDDAVEIRYVVPTSPKGEVVPFCHLRLDYFNMWPFLVQRNRHIQIAQGGDQIERFLVLLLPNCQHCDWTVRLCRHPSRCNCQQFSAWRPKVADMEAHPVGCH